MRTSDATPTDHDAGSAGSAGPRAEHRRTRRNWINANTAAVLTWLVAAPVAFFLPRLLGGNPLSPAATTMAIAAALCLVVGVFVIAIRWSGEIVAGLAAGLAAAWIALMLRTALVGTPFGYGGLYGDMGRTTASVTRYTTTIASTDTLLPSLPSEYPPFFTWLVGRTSVLFDVPGWRLLADFEVLFMSAAVLVGFLLWRRLVGAWVALAIAALTMVTWSDPRKAYEVITLVIFVPWALEVFARPLRPRMHWLPAGLLGGFIAMTYQAWLVYAALGLLALMVIAWRTEPDRWAYLRHVGLVAAVSFVVSSWYVVPYLWATLTSGGKQVSDLYASTSVNSGLFPFLDFSPIGLLQLVGLVGLVWLWRSAWWARPLLLMIMGAYAYRLLSMVRYAATGHTAFLHYTARLYTVLLTVAGVLVLAKLAPIILRRLRLTPPRLGAAALLAVVLAWSAATFTTSWMPPGNRYAMDAQKEPLPGGGYPKFAPKDRRAWFPATQVQQTVEGVLGPDRRPVTLTVDDRLFSYLPWAGYVDLERTASATLSHWDDRFAEVKKLAATTDPQAFATASANTKFGPVDVFVLRKTADGWTWRDQHFSSAQFAPQYWAVADNLPTDLVVVTRKP
jgi:hypothetical protein